MEKVSGGAASVKKFNFLSCQVKFLGKETKGKVGKDESGKVKISKGNFAQFFSYTRIHTHPDPSRTFCLGLMGDGIEIYFVTVTHSHVPNLPPCVLH